MRKLNLGAVEEFTPFPKVKKGGYVCGIYEVKDFPNEEYLEVKYDIIEGEYKGFYNNLKKEKNWELPNFRQYYKGGSLPFFKGLITAVEKSNKGFKFNEEKEKELEGKKVGLVLFEKERINNKGKKVVDMNVDKAHSVEAIKSGDFEVPERETIEDVVETKPTNAFANKSKVEKKAEVNFFEETSEESLPFDTEEDMTDLPFN